MILRSSWRYFGLSEQHADHAIVKVEVPKLFQRSFLKDVLNEIDVLERSKMALCREDRGLYNS